MQNNTRHTNRLYSIWCDMKQRCYNPKHIAYKHYGQKGITICPEWRTDFVTFENWALTNGYKNPLTIERKNNALGYNPENCCWIPKTEQLYNRSCTVLYTVNGITKTQRDWERYLGCARNSLNQVKRRGKSVENYITRKLNLMQ